MQCSSEGWHHVFCGLSPCPLRRQGIRRCSLRQSGDMRRCPAGYQPAGRPRSQANGAGTRTALPGRQRRVRYPTVVGQRRGGDQHHRPLPDNKSHLTAIFCWKNFYWKNLSIGKTFLLEKSFIGKKFYPKKILLETNANQSPAQRAIVADRLKYIGPCEWVCTGWTVGQKLSAGIGCGRGHPAGSFQPKWACGWRCGREGATVFTANLQ